MNNPCPNCLTLPICISRFLKFYDSLNPLKMGLALHTFHSILHLKDKCELVKEYLNSSANPTVYNKRIDRLCNFYITRLQLINRKQNDQSVHKLHSITNVYFKIQ